MVDPQLKALARKIDDLIVLCGQLDDENHRLKANASDWEREREQLVEKTDLARSRVESMIVRLKTQEQES